jgi:hypothetical protein
MKNFEQNGLNIEQLEERFEMVVADSDSENGQDDTKLIEN